MLDQCRPISWSRIGLEYHLHTSVQESDEIRTCRAIEEEGSGPDYRGKDWVRKVVEAPDAEALRVRAAEYAKTYDDYYKEFVQKNRDRIAKQKKEKADQEAAV